jgi:avirulence protein
LKHIEDLYQQLLKAKYPDQRLQLIARIHWWGCHACPCERGSAAIMEAICQGLLEGSNLPFKLNPEKPVDIYALTEPDENQFVKDYVSLLQSTELD